jgi:hypothetical protein
METTLDDVARCTLVPGDIPIDMNAKRGTWSGLKNIASSSNWIDQGATDAIVFARVPNRYTAGLVEVDMKEHLTDRANWQCRLKNEVIDADLRETKASLTGTLNDDL